VRKARGYSQHDANQPPWHGALRAPGCRQAGQPSNTSIFVRPTQLAAAVVSGIVGGPWAPDIATAGSERACGGRSLRTVAGLPLPGGCCGAPGLGDEA